MWTTAAAAHVLHPVLIVMTKAAGRRRNQGITIFHIAEDLQLQQ
jgi:hypothetical protein